jgi:hypothetical protein
MSDESSRYNSGRVVVPQQPAVCYTWLFWKMASVKEVLMVPNRFGSNGKFWRPNCYCFDYSVYFGVSQT